MITSIWPYSLGSSSELNYKAYKAKASFGKDRAML